jgi:cyclopropane fatty-acyl-phospholipid synthase-like methyltransferase
LLALVLIAARDGVAGGGVKIEGVDTCCTDSEYGPKCPMEYFDDEKNVEDYVKMAQGYDGRELIDVLRNYLPEGSSVLELGMGPGTDLEILSEFYQVTGSDRSQTFLDRYQKRNEAADLLWLDAVEMKTERRFDAIYSNKVLHHLTKEEMQRSLQAQADVLNDQGIMLHSLWVGDMEEEQHGLRFVYYTEASFRALLGEMFTVLEVALYDEMEDKDSIYFVLQKR